MKRIQKARCYWQGIKHGAIAFCLLMPSISYAQISIPSQVVWYSNTGVRAYVQSYMAACEAAIPTPGPDPISFYNNPRPADKCLTGECDCIYDVTIGGVEHPSIVFQNWAGRFNQCASGMLQDGSDGYPTTCIGSPTKNQGLPQCAGGTNPINVLSGNKYQIEQDLSLKNGLQVTRYYNSNSKLNIGLGLGWSSNLFGKRLQVGSTDVLVIDADGHVEPWSKVTGTWIGDPDSTIQVEDLTSGFQITRRDESVETYDANGRLLTISDKNGLTLTMLPLGICNR